VNVTGISKAELEASSTLQIGLINGIRDVCCFVPTILDSIDYNPPSGSPPTALSIDFAVRFSVSRESLLFDTQVLENAIRYHLENDSPLAKAISGIPSGFAVLAVGYAAADSNQPLQTTYTSVYVGLGTAAGAMAVVFGVYSMRRRRSLTSVSHRPSKDHSPSLDSSLPPMLPTLSVSDEAETVFDELDKDVDGWISIEELAEYLGIPLEDAHALVAEVKMALYGTVPQPLIFNDTEEAKKAAAQPVINKADFRNVMRDPKAESRLVLPRLMAERYALIFDSIDSDHDGVITPREYAAVFGGVEQLVKENHDFATNFELTFAHMVVLLRQLELGRVALTLTEVMDSKGKATNLSAAYHQRLSAHAASQLPPEIVIDDGQTISDFLESRKHPLPPTQLVIPTPVAPIRNSRSLDIFERPAEVTVVAAEMATDLWSRASVSEEGLAPVDQLRGIVLGAHVGGELLISDKDILELINKLSNREQLVPHATSDQATSSSQAMISYADLIITLAPYVDNGQLTTTPLLGKSPPMLNQSAPKHQLVWEATFRSLSDSFVAWDANFRETSKLLEQPSSTEGDATDRTEPEISSTSEIVNAFMSPVTNMRSRAALKRQSSIKSQNSNLSEEDSLLSPLTTNANAAAVLSPSETVRQAFHVLDYVTEDEEPARGLQNLVPDDDKTETDTSSRISNITGDTAIARISREDSSAAVAQDTQKVAAQMRRLSTGSNTSVNTASRISASSTTPSVDTETSSVTRQGPSVVIPSMTVTSTPKPFTDMHPVFKTLSNDDNTTMPPVVIRDSSEDTTNVQKPVVRLRDSSNSEANVS